MKPKIQKKFFTGIENLVYTKSHLLEKRKLALLSHPSALTSDGSHSSEFLYKKFGKNLVALFGPEHGFFGTGGPGEAITTTRHPQWNIPIYSLYGEFKKPTTEMLKGIDIFIIDLQDLGARCYTFGTTIRYLLEAIQHTDIEVIVADRPVPLPNIVDGPMVEIKENFVAALPVPMCYGMTPAELASFLKHKLNLNIKLYLVPLPHYQRTPYRNQEWFEWIPPSTSIRSWEAGWCYLATVFSEAITSVDIDRQGNMAFRVFGAEWIKNQEVCDELNKSKVSGVTFYPHQYYSIKLNKIINGVRLAITNPDDFYPVQTSIRIISTLQKFYGTNKLWKIPQRKKEWFDVLYGTPKVRTFLFKNKSADEIIKTWQKELKEFRTEREAYLLYHN